jgi:nucleoside 2-deoxyribosyltransferase
VPVSLHVYVAAPFELQAHARQLAHFLECAGAKSTARWLYTENVVLSDEWATKCLRDVDAADVLVAFNPDEYAGRGTGGRHWEAGHANALGKPVIVVGARSHIFHALRRIEHVAIDGDMVTNILAAAATARSRRGSSIA